MQRGTRRYFIKKILRVSGIGILSLLPGSMFNLRSTFAARKSNSLGEDTLDEVLKRVTKSNLYSELNAARISPEEKLAIASVTEISSRDMSNVLKKLRTEGQQLAGGFCGGGCGSSCGLICGISCAEAMNTVGIVDKNGKLKFNIQSLNKTKSLDALERAWKITR